MAAVLEPGEVGLVLAEAPGVGPRRGAEQNKPKPRRACSTRHAVTAKGPRSAQPAVDALVTETGGLWDAASKARREDMAQDPEPWYGHCDRVVEFAQELVRLPDEV